MKVNGFDKINEFVRKRRDAAKPLKVWLKKVQAAQWKKTADIKATFPSVDKVKGYPNVYIFDIAWNRYRLAAVVVVLHGVVIIHKIMTHAEYDRGKWRP